jgi:hypothetical protein
MVYKKASHRTKTFICTDEGSPKHGTPPGEGTRLNKQYGMYTPAGREIWGSLKTAGTSPRDRRI